MAISSIRLTALIGLSILAPITSAQATEQPASPAPAPAPVAAKPAPQPGALDRIWAIPTLYKGADDDVLNDLRIVGRVHIDDYVVSNGSTHGDDLLFRRTRLGVQAHLFDKHLDAHVEGDFNLEGPGPIYSRLTDAYLAWTFSPAAKVTVGKHSAAFTLDGATSSNRLLTIDRSNLANNFWFPNEYTPGVSFSGSKSGWTYYTGIYSGGPIAKEFGDLSGGYFWIGSVGRNLGKALGTKQANIRFDYVYNKPDAKSTATRPFEHIGSLVYNIDDGDWGVMGDFVAAKGSLGQSDAYGLDFEPWYNLSNRFQVVGRYTYLKSDKPNGLRNGRYESLVSPGRGDEYNELYAGLNYFIYGHKLKLQTGLSYVHMRDRANDGGAFDGINWTTGLRLSW